MNRELNAAMPRADVREKIEKLGFDLAGSTAAKSSPQLEIFRKKGIEVLLMADRVDEWALNYLHPHPLRCSTAGIYLCQCPNPHPSSSSSR